MNDILLFLTSKEIMIVYLISAVACVVCLTVYFIEKNNESIRRKHNTKELNKLVELVKEKVPEEVKETYDEPILEPIVDTSVSVDDMLSNIEAKDETVEEKHQEVAETIKETPTIEYPPIEIVEEEKVVEKIVEEKVEEKVEGKIEYTDIEPDRETAKEELKQIEENLVKEMEQEQSNNNIELTKFEQEQEKTAIISLDELLEKSKELYQLNELTQYMDEGNEPISIQDLERQMDRKAAKYDEPFIIANVVNDVAGEETVEIIDENIKEILQVNKPEEKKPAEPVEIKVKPIIENKAPSTFKSTPFISPIFGIERENNIDNDIALENTANYDKLDEEIKKTNSFVMSLKELQEKLD